MSHVIDEEQVRTVIAELYTLEYQKLCFVARHSFSWMDAEEVVQDLFSMICAKPKKLMESECRIGWLYIALRYVGRNYRKKILRQDFASLDGETPIDIDDARASDAYDQVALNDIIDQAAKLVSSETLDMLCLTMQGYKCAEIAKRYGKTTEACKKQIQRGQKKIAAHLDKI